MPAESFGSPPAGSIAVGGAAGKQLLELECTVGHAWHKCVALVDSIAFHCFLLATVARVAGLNMLHTIHVSRAKSIFHNT